MDIIKIVVFAIVGAFLSLVLKEQKAFLGIAVSILTSVIVLFSVLPELEQVISYVRSLYHAAGGKDLYIDNVLKITGITCLTWLGSDILKEAGMTSASAVIKLAGKVVCMGICLPVLGALFEMLTAILPNS